MKRTNNGVGGNRDGFVNSLLVEHRNISEFHTGNLSINNEGEKREWLISSKNCSLLTITFHTFVAASFILKLKYFF